MLYDAYFLVTDVDITVAFNCLNKKYGKYIMVRESFQDTWYAKWMWLHYYQGNDCDVCHTCAKASKELKMRAKLKLQNTRL